MLRLVRRIFVRILLLTALAVLGFVGFQWLTWPDVGALTTENPATTAFIARYGRVARTSGRPAPEWRWVSYGQISAAMKHAVIVAEDQEFFSHGGFSLHEMRASLLEVWRHGKPLRGASTITQQLAKNLWLEPSRNPWRKIKEALLTRELERRLGKRRILELYLNVIELGPGVYGVEAAARTYFGKSSGSLSEEEAAALAAGLSRPSKWHPGSQNAEYLARARRVRRQMASSRWILGQI